MLNAAAILSESQRPCDDSDSACFASYLASFVQMTRTYSPEAATLLEFAINQIAPETPALGPYANYSLIELTEALALAKLELQAGSGPYVCLAAVLDILHGRQSVQRTA